MIRRRSVLIGMGASLSAPFAPKMPAILGGAKTAHATSRAWATHFDGNQQVFGNPLGFPSSSPYGLIALSYSSFGTSTQYLLLAQSGPNYNWQLTIISSPGHLSALFRLPAQSAYPQGINLGNTINTIAGWNTVLIGWDMSAPKLEMWTPGMAQVSAVSNSPPFSIEYVNPPDISISGYWGPNQQLTSPFIGEMTNFYFEAGTKYNLINIIDDFYNLESGYAARRASSGGSATVVKPQVFLSGPASMFTRNFAAGTWTVFPSDQEAAYTDTNPSSAFAVDGNPLTDAATDPFQP